MAKKISVWKSKTFSSDSPGQKNVAAHKSNSVSVKGAEISIFKQ